MLTACNAARIEPIAASVTPSPGAGTGRAVSSMGLICSAFANATISDRRSSARSPRSMRDRWPVLIPDNPATTARDLPRESRISRTRWPSVRASSSTSTRTSPHQSPRRCPGSDPGPYLGENLTPTLLGVVVLNTGPVDHDGMVALFEAIEAQPGRAPIPPSPTTRAPWPTYWTP
jgi:hypothetical protein